VSCPTPPEGGSLVSLGLVPAGPVSFLDGVGLVDHHCHSVAAADLDRPAFEALLTEAPGPDGPDRFESLLGLAVRRWCGPVLGCEPHADPDTYLERRAELGWAEATSRLLRASGADTWLVDTGFRPDTLTSPAELAGLGGGRSFPVTRLEAVAERAGPPAGAAGWAGAVEAAVRAEVAVTGAVGLKTVVAYRSGLAVPGAPPAPAEVTAAAGRLLAGGGGRVADPVLGGWLVHLGARLSAELGLPLQVHTGFGDPDVRLPRADPSLLADLLAATEHTGAVVMLLHCWPFQRQAGYLAHAYRLVRVDVGLAVPYVGARARAVLAELLELAPFRSVCFSSDGFGLPELHHLGAVLWTRALRGLLDEWLAEDVVTGRDADRLVERLGRGTAAEVYPLPPRE
jgi:uncharacterized protein